MNGPLGYPAGPGNILTDVQGLRVGHFDRHDNGYLSGTTVILGPEGGMTAGVDVRGGAPGTRETDLLHPSASVQRVHAIVLTGGSAYGLAAACGVTHALGAAGIGFPVSDVGSEVVPIVPAAVLFDLGRGGAFTARPNADFGDAAVRAALAAGSDARLGSVGAGAGAVTAGLKGGLGMASAVLPDGSIVSALVIANAVGSPVDPRNGELLAARTMLPEDFAGLTVPTAGERDALLDVITTTGPHLRTPANRAGAPAITNTSIGVVATNATLTKAQCAKMAATAHDGLARALNPVHTQFDGDTLFAVSDNLRPAPDDLGFYHILCAAADVVTRALSRGLLNAVHTTTPAGEWFSYLDLAPSAAGQ
jgi:L-aminopeptidase/D-esterase-like protein